MRMSWARLPQPPGLTLRLQQSQDVTCIVTLCISHITVTLLSLQILVLAFERMQSCKYSRSTNCCHQRIDQHGNMHPLNIFLSYTGEQLNVYCQQLGLLTFPNRPLDISHNQSVLVIQELDTDLCHLYTSSCCFSFVNRSLLSLNVHIQCCSCADNW